MTTVISRHTSTISLVSQNSVQLEAGLLVQCLNRYKEFLECGCEKLLNSKFSKRGAGSNVLNNPNSSFSDDTTGNDSALSSIGFENITTSVVRRLDAGARESLGQHLIQLLATIVLPDPPQSISEVDSRLVDGLPGIPDKLMPSDSDMENYRNLAEKGRKKALNLPFDKIFSALKEFSGRFNFNVCVYIVAIAEHVIGNFLQAAICYEDKALTENVIRASTVEKLFILYRDRVKPRRKMFEHRLATANLFPQDYDKCVDELCSFLHTCLEQMNLLIRVFREPILSVNSSSSAPTTATTSFGEQTTTTTTCTHASEDTTQVLFGNILDVYNNMRILLDTIEAEDEDNYSPNIIKSKNDCTSSTSSSSSAVLNNVKPVNTSSTNGKNNTTLVNSLSETSTTLESIPEKQFSSNNDNNEMKSNIKRNNECTHKNINNNSLSASTFHSNSSIGHNDEDDDHDHRRHPQRSKQDSSIKNHSNNNNTNQTYPRRLVGICLIELAEDDSLHAFSQYATIVLDSNSRDRAWNLIEHESYAQELCQLSRSIVHTASLNHKYPQAYNSFSSPSPTTMTDFHSFTCSRCQHWDTIVTKPRRRSTSTTVTPSTNDNNHNNSSSVYHNKNAMSTSVDSADKVDLTSRISSSRHHQHHRSPHLLEMNTSSYAMNCNYLVNATRYLLPRIILLPIFHFFYFHELIETLHRCAYDEVDRARLEDVLSMLRKTRTTLERDLAKHPWVALHLVRLISTGQLTDRYRSLYLNAVTGASCPPSPVNYTAPPSPVSLSGQIVSQVSCNSAFSTNCNALSSNIFNYHNTHHSTPTTTPMSINSTDLSFTYSNTVQNKAEEIEKLLSSKDKLIMSSNYPNTLGDFVMESRVHLRTAESKKSSSEHIAYLFTGLLLICKWQERRSTPLNPNSMQQSILRIKHRIPLDLIHVTDLPPIVQPNLIGYVGHSGPMTPSLVGAAVLAATSSNSSYSQNNNNNNNNNNSSSTMNSHEETSSIGLSSSGFFSSSFNGSISSHSSLISSGGSGGISSFPFLFELEYVDSSSCSPTTLHKSLNHSYNRHHHHHHHMYYAGSQKSSTGRMNYNEEGTTTAAATTTNTINDCNEGNSMPTSITSLNNGSEKFNFTNLSSSINVNHIRIFLRTPEEKADWIASLLSIQSYRLFIRYIRTLPRLEVSLRLPSSHIYKFNRPDSMDNIIFESNMPTSVLYPPKNNSISNQHQQYHCYQQKDSHGKLQQSTFQSAGITNHFDSGKLCYFNESTNYLYATDDTGLDGERKEEDEAEAADDDDDDDGELMESHSLTTSSVVTPSPPSSIICLSSQSSPTTTPLSSNIENYTNATSTTIVTHHSNVIITEHNDDGNAENMLFESHEKQNNTKIMMSMLSNSGSSSTLTLTSHGSSNDGYHNTANNSNNNNNNNNNQTLTNSYTNTIKSLRDYAFQRQSSQSPSRSTKLANIHTNQRFFNSSNFPPQIRMATLDKLIERLTYPTYFDIRLVNCFLLVYRRVTTSDELLDLLIERFRIPDPEFLPEEWNIEVEQGQLESPAQHMLKRFRSGYKKRIQSRVIMFLSRWVRSARYYQNDFAPNPRLRQKLLDFLSTIQARHLISSVERIKQYLQNPPISTQFPETMTAAKTIETSMDNVELSPPPTSSSSSSGLTSVSSNESNQSRNFINRITLNNIHPYKLAEQVTLYEWELYRRIPFWEVESRDRTGNAVPNLNKSKSFSNRFRSWLIYSILSESHPDDRIVGIQRVIDLMLIMEHMNNLQGSQEAKSALISAAVYRLRKSFQAIRRLRHYREVVDRLKREGVHNPKNQRTSSSGTSSSSTSHQNTSMIDSNLSGNVNNMNNNITNSNNNNTNNSVNNHFSSFGLPFSIRTSKSHERRIRVLEKQHASGELCHPCVPYIAAGVMTRLIHLDLCHPDTIINNAGNVMINCWKHRQLAEIVERYLAFQRIPYTYSVDENVRDFLEHVDPFELAGVSSEAEFESKMYQLSELYEPRDTEPANEPIIPEERHMTKEEIQAAQLLSNVSLKERISIPCVLQFNHLLNASNTTIHANNHNSNNNNNNNNNHSGNSNSSSNRKSPLSLLVPYSSSCTSCSTVVVTTDSTNNCNNSTNEHRNSLKKSTNHSSSSTTTQISANFNTATTITTTTTTTTSTTTNNHDVNNTNHNYNEQLRTEIQERKYLRIPNTLSISSHTFHTTISGAKHQHSMSDSHVISPMLSPCHQSTNSVIGVTTAYSATAGLSPPSTPFSSTCGGGCLHQPPPPPLPPRQRRQSCSCWKYSKSINSTGTTLPKIPTPPPSSVHSSNSSCVFFSTTENCKCLPLPPPPPPPPLPPKLNCSNRSTTTTTSTVPIPYNRSPGESPMHSKFFSSSILSPDSTIECSIIETAPPLPPRRNTVNNNNNNTHSNLSTTISDHRNRTPD
ncbi:unnamed protein product [Schistosoma turkestanicum]|nr:unnamed protein product [Schistosoma turkestanicum]